MLAFNNKPTPSISDVTTTLENTRVSPNGLSFEGKSLKLNTEDDAKEVVDAIENFKNLEYLSLEGNTLGVDAAKVIAKALEKQPKFKKAIWKDMFTGRMKTEIPKALQYLGAGLVTAGAKLTELDLSDNAFGPIGVEGLASLLRSSSCYALEELRLNNNGLGITGGKLLATALVDCYNSSEQAGKPLALKVFIAGRNRLENDGAKALAQVFMMIGTLEEIAMPQNGIYHIGISALSEAFTRNGQLQILNLNDNTIGPKGAKAIAKALPNLQYLKQINIGDCLLKTKGALLLADSLKNSHTELEELILGYNEIRTEGGIAIADAVSNKIKLKTLVLDGNQFNKAGRTKITDRLKQIGKLNTLGSLDECDSEEESEDSDENSEDSKSDKEEVEKVNDNILLEVTNKLNINDDVKKEIVTYQDFGNASNADNFIGLGNDRCSIILNEVKKSCDSYLDNLMSIIMKISALSVDNQEDVVKSALDCSNILYKELFTWAEKSEKISLVNNSLLVHLDLIKSEDKMFKPSWNIVGCLFVLETILKQNYIPQSTKDTLQIFLNRSIDKNANHLEAKKKLLTIFT